MQQYRDFVNLVFEYYFPECTVTFEELPTSHTMGPNKKDRKPQLFCFMPHGIFSMGWAYTVCARELAVALQVYSGDI
jgi:hypothetical protein